MPFLSITKLGENAANALAAARSEKPFISVEDLKKRGKVSSAVIEEMQKMGTLAGLSQSNQLSLFDDQQERKAETGEVIADLNHSLGVKAFVRASRLLEKKK